MSVKMTKSAYKQLCKENVEWLEQFPDTLERKHIIAIIHASIEHEYPTRAAEVKRFCPNDHPMGQYDANCDYECIGK